MSRRVLTFGLLALLSPGILARAEKLVSPWDDRKIVQTDAAYGCPAPPPFSRTTDISAYYIDKNASVADPQKLAAFQKASEAPTALSRFAALAADAYLDKGSRAAASCVYSLLDGAAKAEAWSGRMHDFNGVYIQNWLLSAVAISYLKVRPSGVGTREQDAVIQRWFGLVAHRVTDYFDEEVVRLGEQNGISRENNHIYWAGLAVAAAGIARNDPAEFQWGLRAYTMGVDAIQPDGSLPLELWRCQMTLHYHLYALGALVMLAELGEANGLDLYAEDNGAIHRLVGFCLAGLEDPPAVERQVGVKQVVKLPYAGGDIGWAVPYVRRFPNEQLSALLAKAPWVRYSTWGGAPPDGSSQGASRSAVPAR
jgi:poly(beta-D-mannuronate) lyase